MNRPGSEGARKLAVCKKGRPICPSCRRAIGSGQMSVGGGTRMVVCANRLEDEGGRHEACNQHLYILSTTRPPLTLTVAVSRREAEQVRSSMDRTSPPTVNEICERLGVFDLYQLAGSSVEDE